MRLVRPLSLAMILVLPIPSLADGSASLPSGPSFRVETELFKDDAVQPAARHLILFDAGVMYDLRLDNVGTATVYDPARGRVIVIDRARGQHAVVPTAQLAEATAQLRAAVEQEGKAEAFGLLASVTTTPGPTAEQSPILGISFGDARYQTTVDTVKNPAIPAAYNRFAMLAAQLNVVRRIGVAPFARLTLGHHMAQQNVLPLETTLELRNGLRKERYRSHLIVVEQLSANDRDRINELGRVLAASKEVPLDEFGG